MTYHLTARPPALVRRLLAEERALLDAEHELLVTQPETEADCDGLFGALSELFALVMASLVAQPALSHLHAALDAFGTKVRTMPAEALLHAEDDALDAIRLAVESRGDAEAEGSGS